MKIYSTVLALFICLVGLAGAKQSQTAADISGKWHVVFDTQDGNRIFDPVFEQQGTKVSGKWDDANVQGTFDDGKLNLEFPMTSKEVGKGTLSLKGKLAGDDLTGHWRFQAYEGNFTATRAK